MNTPKFQSGSRFQLNLRLFLLIALVGLLRLLTPYVFLEQIAAAPAIVLFFGSILVYTYMHGRFERWATSEILSSAVLLFLTLSAVAVLLDPVDSLRTPWWPKNVRDLPGLIGILTFLLCVTVWSILILLGTSKRLLMANSTIGPLGCWPNTAFLVIPFFLIWICMENIARGNTGLPYFVFSVATTVLVGIFLSKWFGPGFSHSRVIISLSRFLVKCWKDDWLFAVVIALLAFCLRAGFAYKLNLAILDPALLGGPDSGAYDQIAWELASGRKGFFSPHLALYTFNPGPCFFYASIYKFVGHRPDIVRYVQAAIAAITVIMLFRLGSMWFGSVAARVGAILIAGRGYLAVYSVYLGSETLGLFFATLLIIVLHRIRKRFKEGNRTGFIARAFGAGLLMGILILNRPEFQAFILVGGIWILVVVRQERAKMLGAWILGAILFLVPIMARNYVVVGDYNVITPVTPFSKFSFLTKHVKPPMGISDARYYKDLYKFVSQQPVTALKATTRDLSRNFSRFWHWRPLTINPAFIYFLSTDRGKTLIGSFLLSMFILGIWASRKEVEVLSFVFLLFIFKTCVHLVLSTKVWYRYTIEPFVILFQGYGISLLVIYIRNAFANKGNKFKNCFF